MRTPTHRNPFVEFALPPSRLVTAALLFPVKAIACQPPPPPYTPIKKPPGGAGGLFECDLALNRKALGLFCLAFCGLSFEVSAGFLIDTLHRQLDLAPIIKANHLDLNDIAFFTDIGCLGHTLILHL